MQLRVHGYEFDIDGAYLDAPPEEIEGQVAAYERGQRTGFDLGVSFPDGLVGRVMREMVAIPYGETRTYGDLASTLASSPVAVGQTCGRNPIPVVVPCHRVVGANSLGGFSSPGGPAAKRTLLANESGQTELVDWQD